MTLLRLEEYEVETYYIEIVGRAIVQEDHQIGGRFFIGLIESSLPRTHPIYPLSLALVRKDTLLPLNTPQEPATLSFRVEKVKIGIFLVLIYLVHHRNPQEVQVQHRLSHH